MGWPPARALICVRTKLSQCFYLSADFMPLFHGKTTLYTTSAQHKAQHHAQGTASDQSISVPSLVALLVAANVGLSAVAARWVISEHT